MNVRLYLFLILFIVILSIYIHSSKEHSYQDVLKKDKKIDRIEEKIEEELDKEIEDELDKSKICVSQLKVKSEKQPSTGKIIGFTEHSPFFPTMIQEKDSPFSNQFKPTHYHHHSKQNILRNPNLMDSIPILIVLF